MALIKCPECGRKNVSDSAQVCPNCGYGIKAHFERLKEAKKIQEKYAKGVSQLKKPKFTVPIVTILISILWLWSGVVQLSASEMEVKNSIAHGKGDPHFYGKLFIIIGMGLFCYSIYLFSKHIEAYKLLKAKLPKCPYCNSCNVTKITTTETMNTVISGLKLKRKYQWHCNKCKSDF